MRIEALTVALRPRTPWEAVELGTALVRRHARAIWLPWLWLTLPVFVLANLLAWSVDALWLAGLVMWWLKPAFDRIPLFVLSRAVFGEAPSPRETLRAQREWGLGWLPAYLLWRRLGPVRALYLPVDLLEGGHGRDARERRRALGGPVHGVGMLLTVACLQFEVALYLGLGALAFMFVPGEYLPQVADQLLQVLSDAPPWLTLASNLAAWLATSLIEPFYVGAGFGLYLNRRTEIEAWDIELALRRLRARLLRGVAPVLLTCAIGMAWWPSAVRAQEAPSDAAQVAEDAGDLPRATPERVFGTSPVDDRGLREAVRRAHADPTVSPKRTVTTWKRRAPAKAAEAEHDAPLLRVIAKVVAALGEFGLWLLVGMLAILLVATAPRWIAWFRAPAARAERVPDAVRRREAGTATMPLPDDVAGAIHRLWQQQRHRESLALLYRASVEAMVARTGAVLVPGATEAQVLRASRALSQDGQRDAFARAVRAWQYAAYAERFPTGDEFESLLRELAQRFGWGATPVGAAAAVDA